MNSHQSATMRGEETWEVNKGGWLSKSLLYMCVHVNMCTYVNELGDGNDYT